MKIYVFQPSRRKFRYGIYFIVSPDQKAARKDANKNIGIGNNYIGDMEHFIQKIKRDGFADYTYFE